MIKGRGAQINTLNPFEAMNKGTVIYETENIPTKYINVFPKSLVNKVDSPDLRMEYSMNPYQGCEHGCVYCYARNSHNYWGYSAGLEFESNILIKQNAAQLLERKLSARNWQGKTIVISGNTDPYQQIERKQRITRSLLDICLQYGQSVGLITKGAGILKDLDILKQLAQKNLVIVNISMTTLVESTRNKLEPRAASVNARLKAIAILSNHGIPVNVMIAPIIPSINDHEIHDICRITALLGAYSASYSLVRLNGEVKNIFTDWIEKAEPLKAKRVLQQIKACHKGLLSNSQFHNRMKGSGELAAVIRQVFRQAHRKYFDGRKISDIQLDTQLYKSYREKQYSLF